MLVALLVLLLGPVPQGFDELAAARDVAALEAKSTKELAASHPFAFLKVNGAYQTGRFGWHAVPLHDVAGGRKYVVFTTALTSEDTGEQFFEERNGTFVRFIPETETFGFKITRHAFDVSFVLENKQANISDVVSFLRVGAPRASFMFRMSPNYVVKSISDSSGKPVRFAQGGGTVSVVAPKANAFSYKVVYSGIVDKPRYAGSISTREAFLTNDYWWPMIARGPASYQVTVHGLKTWTVVCQGEKVRDVVSGVERQTTYDMELPVSVFSLSVAPYKTASKIIDGRRFTIWSMNATQEQADMQAELYAPILKFYENFAPYPFSGYGALMSSVYGGGALEAYSFATYGGGETPGEDAHEPSHSWWGGIIPNTYLRSLWNESFAVFSDGLFHREGGGGVKGDKRLAFVSDASSDPSYWKATVANSPSSIGGAASALGYGKGAKVLQMLENDIGTDKMIGSMREWIRMHKLGDAGEWEEYEKAVDKVTGKSYKWFFDEWLRRKGWADFDVSDVTWENGKVTGKLRFVGEPYLIHSEVMLEYADGNRVFKKFSTMEKKLADGSYEVSIDSARKPVIVSIDPWLRILRRYANDERPFDIENCVRSYQKYTDRAHKDWLSDEGESSLSALPPDLDKVFLVGSPESTAAMAPLCAKVGFRVSVNSLTYKGTTIDLQSGAALALVDLGGGKRCLIGLGKTRQSPNPGHSQTCIVDGYGRFLAGETEPKRTGWMTFRL